MSSSPDLPSSPRVRHIPRSDDPRSHVLVHVSPLNSTDLNLAATEGEHPYIGSVKQSSLKKLRGKNYQGSDEEWAQIVYYALGMLSVSDTKKVWSTGVETSASISGSDDEDQKMVITIRKRIQSITQRLGSITLQQDDEQSLELFDWCASAAARADALEAQISSLSSRYSVAEDTIEKLNKQLEEFIRVKDQDQNQLIVSFTHLLNEKKLKIRNQQRLLAAAKVDPAKASEASQAQISPSPRSRTGRSRTTKRTAREMSANESESDGGFENMEVDSHRPEGNQEEDETDDGPSTPQPLEEEDATTTDEDPKPPPIERLEGKAPSVPSPRRELPFIRRGQRGNQAQAQPHREEKAAEDTSGETDDDEL